MSDESAAVRERTYSNLNKGEWSELYAFFRLLSEGRLYAADEKLNRIANIFYPILEIIRNEVEDEEYKYKTANTEESCIRIFLNEEYITKLPVCEFTKQANILLSELQRKQKSSFCVPETEKFSYSVFISKFKADPSQKADIRLKLHDIYTGYEPEVGFSIKSDLGSAPTLLNAGATTNFIYRVKNLPDENIDEIIKEINAVETKSKIRDRLNAIVAKGGELHFIKTENEIFADNLIMIDSNMDTLLAVMLLAFYQSKLRTCLELTNHIIKANPLKFSPSLAKNFYLHKIKTFLCAVALGVRPATPWDGQDEANGGYIIVKEDGDIVAYHIYNRDAFKAYLLNTTRLETASTSRYGFGKLYKENGELYIKLNLQIRFI